MSTINTTTSTFRISSPIFGATTGNTYTGYEIAGTGYTNFSNSGTLPTISGVSIIVDALAKSVVFRSTSSGVQTNALFIINGEWDDSGWSYTWVDGCNGNLFFGPNAKWRSGSSILGHGGFTLTTSGGAWGADWRDKTICVDQINGANVSYTSAEVNWFGVKYTHNGANNATRGDVPLVFPIGVSGTIRNLTMYFEAGGGKTFVGGPNTITFDNIISWNALWGFNGPYRALTPTAPISNYITGTTGSPADYTKFAPAGPLVANDKITYYSPSRASLAMQILGPDFNGEAARSWTPVLFNGYRFLTNDGTTANLTNFFSTSGYQYYNFNTGRKYEFALQSRLRYTFIDTSNNNINNVRVSVLNGSTTDSTRTRYVPSYAIVTGTQDTMAIQLLQDLSAGNTNTLTVEPSDIYCYSSTTNTTAYVNFSTTTVSGSLSPTGLGFDYIGAKVAYAKRWGYYDYIYSWSPTQDNATRNIQGTFVRDTYVKTTTVADEATANISNITLTNNSTNYLTFNQNSFITGDYIDGNQVYMKALAYKNADDQRPKNDFSIVNDELIFSGATDISLYNPPTVWTATTGLRAVNAIKTSGTYTRSNTAGFTGQVFCKITARNISLGTQTTNRTQLYLNTAAGSGSISWASDPASTSFTVCDGGAIVAGSTSSNFFQVPRYLSNNTNKTLQNCDIGGYYICSPGTSGTTGSALNLTNVKLVSNVTLNRATSVSDAYRFAPLTVNLTNINYNGFTLTSTDANIVIRNPWSVTLNGTDSIAQSAVKVAKIYTDTAVDTNKTAQTVSISGGSGTGLPLTFTAQVPLNLNKSFIAFIDGFEPATAYVGSTSEASVTQAAVSISSDVMNFQQTLLTADTTLISNCTVTCTGSGTNQKVTIGIPSTSAYTQASIAASKLMFRRIQELTTAADDYHYKLARGTFINLIVYQTYGFQVKSSQGIFTIEKITANDNNVSFVIWIVNANNILYTQATSTNIQKYVVFLLASPGAVLLLTNYDRETIAQYATDAIKPTLITVNDNIGVVNSNVKDSSLLVPASRDISTIV